jgi:TPR repeat protein
MYRTGRGLPRDMDQATRWYGRSAEGGYPMAQFTLGNMHLKGDGVARNIPLAIALFERAAAQGHEQAQYNLGVYYYDQGTEQGYRKAEKWFLQAAGRGEPSSQYALGRLYSAPHDGVRLDRVRAYAWYSLALANGYSAAAAPAAELEKRLSAAEKASARAMARRLAKSPTE